MTDQGGGLHSWIDDDREVVRRALARQDDPLFADLWWDVALIARLLKRLTCGAQGRVAVLTAHAAAIAADDVLRRLPPPAVGDFRCPPPRAPLSELRALGPSVEGLRRLSEALCGDLDQPWSCPDRLAGLLTDVQDELLVYAGEAARIAATTAPRSRNMRPCRVSRVGAAS